MNTDNQLYLPNTSLLMGKVQIPQAGGRDSADLVHGPCYPLPSKSQPWVPDADPRRGSLLPQSHLPKPASRPSACYLSKLLPDPSFSNQRLSPISELLCICKALITRAARVLRKQESGVPSDYHPLREEREGVRLA